MASKIKKAMYNKPRFKEMYDIGNMNKREEKTIPSAGLKKVKSPTVNTKSHCQPKG
jgi:hypothetical protein